MSKFNDERVWLDRTQMHQTYGAFPQQKFHSQEYTGEYMAQVKEFADKVHEFQEWCRAAYFAASQGQPQWPEPPSFLQMEAAKATPPSKKRTTNAKSPRKD